MAKHFYIAAAAFAALTLWASGASAQQAQGGLVNVAIDDSLNNVVSGNSVAIPVELAAQVCNVDVGVLADLSGNRTVEGCTITQDMVTNNAALNNYMADYKNKGQAIKATK
jgi:hypothetical protein